MFSLFLWIPVSTFAFFEREEEPLARQIIRRFNRKFGFTVEGEKGENWKVKRRVWSKRWEGVDIISDNGRLERRALLADEYVVSDANLHLLPNSQTEIELTNDGYPARRNTLAHLTRAWVNIIGCYTVSSDRLRRWRKLKPNQTIRWEMEEEEEESAASILNGQKWSKREMGNVLQK